MTKTKKNSVLCFVCLILLSFSFCFVGCGTNLSYEDFKADYNFMLSSFNGSLFDEKDLKISYNSNIQTFIEEATVDDQIQKLSNDIKNGQAIFEPVLRTSFETVNLLIDAFDTSKVTTKSLEKVNGKLKTLQESLTNLKRDKIQLESVSETKEQVKSWLFDYEKTFVVAIEKANDFTLSFLEMYENEILTENDISGRISPKKTIVLLVKTMTQCSYAYALSTLSEIYDQKVETGQNISNQILESFLNVKSKLLGSEGFQNIRNLDTEASVFEQNMINNYELLCDFQTEIKYSISKIEQTVNVYDLKTLRNKKENNKLSTTEKICLDAVDEAMNSVFVITKNYHTSITSDIKSWSETE